MSTARRVLHLELSGLVAVHAVRAVHTALGGVAGIDTADVHLKGATVEVSGPYDATRFAADVQAALEPIGIRLEGVRVVQERVLPLA